MTVVFLTTTGAGTWTVPSDWSNTNSVECIGAGGGGGKHGAADHQAPGGGAGAYAKKATITTLSPGNVVNLSIGAAGAGATTQDGGTGGDTWFGNSVYASALVGAKGGTGGLGTTGVAGTGGTAAASIGDSGAKFSGGNGGTVSDNSYSGTGGGGAGGPVAAGANGGTETWGGAGTNNYGGSGGGAANGGSAGATVFQSATSVANGSAGGANSSAAGAGTGGTGGVTPTAGGPGTATGAGGGGGGGTATASKTCGSGGAGAAGTDWDSTHGVGGGGGGGGGGPAGSDVGGVGGAGGLYGGGGGGGGAAATNGNGGAGGQGLIVITYTANSAITAAFSDTRSPTETYAPGMSVVTALSDAPTITDGFTASFSGTFDLGLSDAPAISESLTPRMVVASALSDTPSVTDTLTATIPAINGSYTTSFPLTENPIAENGAWTHAAPDWAVMRTVSTHAVGTQSGSSGITDDSYAHLTGTWADDQEAQATVYRGSLTGTSEREVELLLRVTDTSTTVKCYEFQASINTSWYVTIVRWNGALGDYTFLVPVITTGLAGLMPLGNGDKLRAVAQGYDLSFYVDKNLGSGWQLLCSCTDTGQPDSNLTRRLASGRPGIGHWFQNASGGAVQTEYGFSQFSATDLGVFAATFTDTRAPAESFVTGMVAPVALSDVRTPSEILAGDMRVTSALSDVRSPSETFAGGMRVTSALSDIPAITEIYAAGATVVRSFADTPVVSDAFGVTLAGLYVTSFSDTILPGEVLSASMTVARSLSDAPAIADIFSTAPGHFAAADMMIGA